MKRKAAGPIFDCSYEGSVSEQKTQQTKHTDSVSLCWSHQTLDHLFVEGDLYNLYKKPGQVIQVDGKYLGLDSQNLPNQEQLLQQKP